MAEQEATEVAPTAEPTDADALRGFHFRRLARKPLTLGLTFGFALAAGVAAAILVGAAIGAGAAIAVLLLAALIVFAIADSKAADAFFSAYAAERGLTLGGRTSLPAATPLLRKGDDRYAERTLTGAVAEGVEGTLALYTYEDETTDSQGNSQTNYYHYTVGLVEVPECASLVPELYCQKKFGLHALEKLEDAFRRSKERVHLESAALDDRYEIFAGKGQDANRLRRLFSPSFIVWLTEGAPKKFAFELLDGTLCCYVNGHKEKAADLDEVCAGTGAVAARLREEALE